MKISLYHEVREEYLALPYDGYDCDFETVGPNFVIPCEHNNMIWIKHNNQCEYSSTLVFRFINSRGNKHNS